MTKSVDLDLKKHQALNTFPKLLGDDDVIEKIVFWDVGTGNCNLLYGANGTPLVYFDFGGNMGTGAKTYPYKNKPDDKKDNRPVPKFPHNGNKVKLVMSHWDEDHVYSLKAQPDMAKCAWLGPREDLAPKTTDLVAKIAKNLRVWNDTTDKKKKLVKDAVSVAYQSKKGAKIVLHRCKGNAKNVPSKQNERNDTGIAMVLELDTPTRAEAAAREIEEHAKNNVQDSAGALQKGNAVVGHDVYRECVLTAASLAAAQYATDAWKVAFAARAAVSGTPVKAATLAILTAVEMAAANKATPAIILGATLAALDVLDKPAADVLRAMAGALNQNVRAVVVAAAGAMVFIEKAAMDTLLAASDAAAGNKQPADVYKDAASGAGVLSGFAPVAEILAAIQDAVLKNSDANGAVAAGIAVAKQDLRLIAGVAALEVMRQNGTPNKALSDAIVAVIAAMGPKYPMFGRAMNAASSEVVKGSNTAAVVKAMVDTLDAATSSVRSADASAVLVKMKVRLLQNNPTNAALETAAEAPKAGEYYAHRVIKAIRAKIAALKATANPAAVLQAGVDLLDNVPKEWKTRVLLTGDACFQALPAVVLKSTEWDVLLAYHHGSRDNFVAEPKKKQGNVSDPPVPVLKDISTIVYSAGRRASGSYVHKHPEQPAIDKYKNGGWTVELHTHEWPAKNSKARGDRTYKLPYAP